MQRRRVAKTLILFIALSLINSSLSHSQTTKPVVRIKVDTENEYGDKKRIFTNLYTIINRRQYFIDRLERVSLGLPDPLGVDPTGRYVFYTSNTGCGFEQGGMTIFESDVYGKKKAPILGSCMYLGAGFLSFQGKNYLLITQSSEALECSFWLYDVSRGEFVLHADGGIEEIKKGVFSYGYCEGDTELKQIGTITMETLIRRGPPLKLLPIHSTHGITQKRNVRVYPSVLGCDIDDNDKQYKTISTPGTSVLILEACEDGGYEVYYEGFRGKVMKGNIRPVKFGPRK